MATHQRMAAEKKTNRGGIMALVSRFSSKMSVFTLGVKCIIMKLNYNYEMRCKSKLTAMVELQ